MIKEKIMVVEDDAITAMEIKENLELWGYQVPITVKAGEDAVKEAFRIQPDLIIMNIALQGEMDGIEAAEQIKELDIPILYLSGLVNTEIIERTRTQPYLILKKPFNQKDLKDKIEMLSLKLK